MVKYLWFYVRRNYQLPAILCLVQNQSPYLHGTSLVNERHQM